MSLCSATLPKRAFLILFIMLGLAGCQSLKTESFSSDGANRAADPSGARNLFVFFDGTRNHSGQLEHATNVYRLFEEIRANRYRDDLGLYIAGVGTSTDLQLSETVLGVGMEERILSAYAFLASNYRIDDKIFIFGFSRGAHQARALAGLIAYAGLPDVSGVEASRVRRISNRLLELTKDQQDISPTDRWLGWTPGKSPPLAHLTENDLTLRSAAVTFLGLWDTVPGSFFKTGKFFDSDEYHYCKEDIRGRGMIGRHSSKGERYKSGSYPPIRNIAHAVSIDEKRSKFKPLLLCAPVDEQLTNQAERWFPGAHADVGGGYDDQGELPAVSRAWMLSELRPHYAPAVRIEAHGSAYALAHWSVDFSPSNMFSDCEDRTRFMEVSLKRKFASVDSSFDQRRSGSALIKPTRKSPPLTRNYPIACGADSARALPAE